MLKITIEGPQGSGKSRLAQHIAASLDCFTEHITEVCDEGDPDRSAEQPVPPTARIFVKQTQ